MQLFHVEKVWWKQTIDAIVGTVRRLNKILTTQSIF